MSTAVDTSEPKAQHFIPTVREGLRVLLLHR
jgi:hypothetical protein